MSPFPMPAENQLLPDRTPYYQHTLEAGHLCLAMSVRVEMRRRLRNQTRVTFSQQLRNHLKWPQDDFGEEMMNSWVHDGQSQTYFQPSWVN